MNKIIENIKNKNPLYLIPLGVLSSNIGNGMYTLAVGKLFYDATGATSSFAIVLLIEAGLSFLTQSFASIAADKGRSQKIATIAENFRGIIIIIASIVAYLGNLKAIYIATIAISLLRPFYRTSTFALGPLIAQENKLARYNANISTSQQIGQFIGAGMAGGIIAIFNPYVAIAINGISYLISGTCLNISLIPEQIKSKFKIEEFKEYFSIKKIFINWYELILHLLKRGKFFYLILLCSTDFIIISFINMSYAPLLKFTDSSPFWISIWDVFFAIGAIIGVNIFGRIKKMQVSLIPALLSLLIEGIMIILIVNKDTKIIMLVMLVLGITNSISVASFSYFLQSSAKKEFLGRISGVRQFGISISTFIFIPVISRAMNSSIKESTIIVFAIVFVSVIGAIILLNRSIIKMKEI